MSEHSSPTELTAILADHKLWLYANGGKRANLRDANLYGANHDNWTTWPSGFTPPQ